VAGSRASAAAPPARYLVSAHVRELVALGWDVRTEDRPNGVKLVVITSDRHQVVKLRALCFMGIMAQGAHH
jgi:hypothetical protein